MGFRLQMIDKSKICPSGNIDDTLCDLSDIK